MAIDQLRKEARGPQAKRNPTTHCAEIELAKRRERTAKYDDPDEQLDVLPDADNPVPVELEQEQEANSES